MLADNKSDATNLSFRACSAHMRNFTAAPSSANTVLTRSCVAQVPGWSGAACTAASLPPRGDVPISRSDAPCGAGPSDAVPPRVDRRSPDAALPAEPNPPAALHAAAEGDPESSAAADVTALPTSPVAATVSAAASRPPTAHHEAMSRPTPPRTGAERAIASRRRAVKGHSGRRRGLRSHLVDSQTRCSIRACPAGVMCSLARSTASVSRYMCADSCLLKAACHSMVSKTPRTCSERGTDNGPRTRSSLRRAR